MYTDILLNHYINILASDNITPTDNDLIKIKTHCSLLNNWLVNPTYPNLYIYGPQGTGKTTLLKALARLLNQLDDIYCNRLTTSITSQSLYTIIAQQETPSIPEIFNLARHVIIDDVGAEPPAIKSYGNIYQPVWEITKYRCDKHLSTILSSNYQPKDLASYYSCQRLNDILNTYTIITINGHSHRKENTLNNKKNDK